MGEHIVEIIIIIVLIAAVAWGIYHIVRKSKHGGGCCGEHEEAEKRIAVKDRNKSHYPYTITLKIEGMTCENCARRVENALNSLDGIWAKVDISSNKAKVRCKQPLDEKMLLRAVTQAGYAANKIEK